MYLTIYDLSGIQRYIFATGKLREQVGASKIIHNILYEELRQIVGGYAEDTEEKKNLLAFDDGKKCNIVYIGGGNAVVLYKDKDYMNECTKNLQKKVLELTGNKLRLCSAYVEIKGTEVSYYDLYIDLMKAMVIAKQHSSSLSLSSGFAIGEHDPITLEPITYFPESQGYQADCGAASRIQKERYFVEENSSDGGGYRYATEFERFRSSGRKSFVAVIHIDGDTMGQQIQAVVQSFSNQKTLEESMIEMRSISKEIDHLYKTTLKSSVDSLYKPGTDEIPIRPLISDGDDITLLIEAGKAFDFVENFMLKLKENGKDKVKFKRINEYKFNVSASAGVVFVHDKFPFYVAYDIAEELCKSAKAVKAYDAVKVANMDFHVVQSGMKSSLEEYRQENYIKYKGNKVYQLHTRPYFFDEKGLDNSYSSFKTLREKLNKSMKGQEIARGKLKGLRDAYAKNVNEAERYYNFILSRDEGKMLTNLSDKAFKEGTEGNAYAYFFDALEVMDLIDEKDESEVEIL